ncbi:MAG: molybdopterin molybdotransferase MoeA [Actinomycetia bacterium]|nr:molybdopterin molybdotransferase MoeA [Actinomycetes bacterium]
MSGCYKDRILISVEDAQEIMLGHVAALEPERIGIAESFGRVLAEDIESDIDISPFSSSAMDGFAICLSQLTASQAKAANCGQPLRFSIIGIIGAGESYTPRLLPGQALRIMTGAPIPTGADTVVPIEEAEVLGECPETPAGLELELHNMPAVGSHIRAAGEEARAGDVLLHIGETLSAAACGLLAAAGHTRTSVYRRPRVAVIATGNELVDASEVPRPGFIRDSNSFSLAAAVIEAGGIADILPRLKDDEQKFATALSAAAASHDFVVTSGGAAEGDFDYVTATIRKIGQLYFNKVNMKPGKSQSFGMVNGTPVIGLAGNPSAAACGFEMLVRPCLRKMQGHSALFRPVVCARLADGVHKKPEKRRLYLRARLSADPNGGYLVLPDSQQNSALLGGLNRANCLLIVPEGLQPATVGSEVNCVRIDLEAGTV